MAERAAALGWDQTRIHIIDSDQGRSGIGVEHRDGFRDMRDEISKGGVGIILSYEVSRLSRRSSDWYSLMDLASMFGTLIADADGVYDPRIFNDRLVLGLKGTMSEAESHQMKMRLHEGLKNQVRRGTYRQRLPTGLVRRTDGTGVKHPDRDVRRVLRLVFKKFEELKSCGQVFRYLRQHNIQLPRNQMSGRHKGKLCWKLPSRTAVLDIITNPAYAGAFVYGRRQSHNLEREPDSPATTRRSQAEWLHVQPGAYPAYITWEQLQANIAQIKRNSTLWDERVKQAQGVVREGAALLPGLTVCGSCGKRMKVTYNKKA